MAIGNLLVRAYDDFVRSTPLTERVFKVLKDAENKQRGTAGCSCRSVRSPSGQRPTSNKHGAERVA